jgi:hypothetical protein
MLVTRVDVVVISVLVLAVGFLCFTAGMWVRRDSDHDLIQELYRELDARRMEMPPEIAHEPRGYLEVPDWQGDLPALNPGTPIRHMGMIYRDPEAEQLAALELRQAAPEAGWDLDAYIEGLVRRSAQDLAELLGGEQ